MNRSTAYRNHEAYPTLRRALTPELVELSDEDLESAIEVLYQGELSAEDLENIWKSLSNAGRSMGKALRRAAPAISGIAQQALPVIGTVAGTAIGGPLGATLGGAAGRALSGVIGGKGNIGKRVAAGLSGAAAGVLPGVLGSLGGAAGPLAQVAQRAMTGGGGAAAGRLLQTLSRPETLKALTSMAMGPIGRPQVPVAGTQVPVAAFANLLGVLSNQAAAEQHRLTAGESSSLPAYLTDAYGEAIGDPLDSVSRAEVLFARLADAEALELADHDDGVETWSHQAWEEAVEAENEYWNEIAASEAEYAS